MSSLTEQSESETTNRKSGSSNGSTASPNLSQNAHGNRGTDTKGKSRMASRAAVLGTPNGGGAPSCGIPLFSFCMYKIRSVQLCTCRWRNSFQLWLIFCYSFEEFQVYNDQFQTQGAGMQEPEDGSNYMHLYIRTSNHAPRNLECLLETKGRPKLDALNWSSITPTSHKIRKQCKSLLNVLGP